MSFRRQTVICREGWYYMAIMAVVLGGALLKEVNLLLILGGMLLGPIVLNWRAVRDTLLGLTIERKLPQRLGAGEVLSVNLNLTNSRRRLGAWAVVAEEQIERETAAGNNAPPRSRTFLRPSVLFPYVPAGGSRKGVYRGRIAERGRYRFGPLKLTTQFPFGLFSRTVSLGQSETLLVLPKLGRLTDVWAARRQEALAGADRRRRPGAEGDFYGVREWRGGDSRRLIHWRSSARLGKLVVRQFERPRTRDVAIVLDLWQSEQPTAEQTQSVELAVSFAATVLADVCRGNGSNVCLALCNSKPECIEGPASPATLQGMTEQLAIVEGRAADMLPTLLAHALPRIPSDSEIVLVSTRPVDLADSKRFPHVWSDPQLRDRARHVFCIDASNEKLLEFFHFET